MLLKHLLCTSPGLCLPKPPNSPTDGSTTLPPFSREQIELKEVKQLRTWVGDGADQTLTGRLQTLFCPPEDGYRYHSITQEERVSER